MAFGTNLQCSRGPEGRVRNAGDLGTTCVWEEVVEERAISAFQFSQRKTPVGLKSLQSRGH